MSQTPSRVDRYVEAYRARQEIISKLRAIGIDLVGIGRFLSLCTEDTIITPKGIRNRVGNQHEYLARTEWPTLAECVELVQRLEEVNKRVEELYKELSEVERQLVAYMDNLDADDPFLK